MASAQKLYFITLSTEDAEPITQNPVSRRLIRTRAARAAKSYYANGLSAQHHEQSIAASSASQRGGMNRFRSRPASAKAKGASTGTFLSPLNDRLSVWDPLVSPLGRQAWELLHYYRYSFRARSWAINAKKDWFAFIIEDPAATHATLSFVALNRDLEEGTTVSAWTLNHRHKALQLVRRELAKEQTLPKDALIGAVALLAITEGLEGHSSSSSAHVNALSNLIHLRGGLAQLQSNEALSRLVAWADLCHVSTFSSGPRLPSLFNQADVVIDQFESDTQENVSYTLLYALERSMPTNVFKVVKLLGAVPRHPPTETVTPQERQNVSRLIYHINQSLLSIHYADTAFDDGPVGKLARTLCYAAHLYISLVLRQMPRRTKVVVERVVRLSEALHELESVTVWDKLMIESYLVISLWAQTLHFCSLVPAAQVVMQRSELKRLLSAFAIKNIEQFYQQLSKISWIRSSFDDELSRILA